MKSILTTTFLLLSGLLSVSGLVKTGTSTSSNSFQADVYKRNQWKGKKVGLPRSNNKGNTAKRATISAQCSSDAMCQTSGKTYCVSGQCAVCISDSDCNASKGGAYCTTANTCATAPSSCDDDTDCSSGNKCSSAGTCLKQQICRNDNQCRSSPNGYNTGAQCQIASYLSNSGTCSYTVSEVKNVSGNRFSYTSCILDNSMTYPLGTGTKGVDYFSSSSMTVGLCTSYCESKKYTLAGVEGGNDCYCGNKYNARFTTAGTCDYSCYGASSQLCGGYSGLAVYQNVGK